MYYVARLCKLQVIISITGYYFALLVYLEPVMEESIFGVGIVIVETI